MQRCETREAFDALGAGWMNDPSIVGTSEPFSELPVEDPFTTLEAFAEQEIEGLKATLVFPEPVVTEVPTPDTRYDVLTGTAHIMPPPALDDDAVAGIPAPGRPKRQYIRKTKE